MSSPRTIFITGANQGLGMHTVKQLAATPDVLVFMGSRKLASAEEAIAKFASDIDPSSTVVPVQLDITEATSIQNAHDVVSKTLQEKNLSGLDVLVNNAGISAAAGPPEVIFATNVFGTGRLTEAFLPLIKKGGSILNISSGLGSNTTFSSRPAHLPTAYLYYSASKAALNSLTVQWALDGEQNGSGIRVISICPGLNATNFTNYVKVGANPADGCKVIVKEALAKEGKTSVFVHKDGKYPW
ncbi:putative short chain dehydrogenase family protein [Roridomyces roridus]|uniref:Short chain dehydrogenase family protein n=1 Tax=Roridomyces roridus TaxID=1738132 RepID=A0AAD7BSZ6_9AGAR|nr:putative short chain dehydrogenase family protein [Roridomyces roridus]